MSTISEADKKRIIDIATQLVAGQVENGKINPDDEQALRKATKEAVATARAAYFAALEYVLG